MKKERGILVERVSNSFVRILFNTEEYHVPTEILEDPMYFDRFINPNHSARIDFGLDWAGIIDISVNPLMMDTDSVDVLIKGVVNSLQ